MESHPLSLGDSPSAAGSSAVTDSYLAPPTFVSRNDTIRGASSSSQARPGYFDLQRLAAAHAEATNAVSRDRKSSASYTASVFASSSIAPSSQDSEDGMEELDDSIDGESDEEEEIPRWLQNANSTITDRRPASRNSVVSNYPKTGSKRVSVNGTIARGNDASSSRNSRRSPAPSSPAYKKSTPQTHETASSLFPPGDFEGQEASEAVQGDSKPSQQFLSSLYLMTDEELDRHLGIIPSTSSRPKTAPLQSQTSKKSGDIETMATRSISGDHLTVSPTSYSGRSSSASVADPEAQAAMVGDKSPSRAQHKLLRDLSERFGSIIKDQDLSRRAFEKERERLLMTLNAQKKESEARELALREILLTMGVSKARLDRAIVQATSEAHIPVINVDEQLSEHLRRSDLVAAGRLAQTKATNDELLPASLREAMLEAADNTSPLFGRDSFESVRRPLARRATTLASHEAEEGQTPVRSSSPDLSLPLTTTIPSIISTPTARSAWGSGLVPWVGTTGGSRKARASIQATSPAAVEADGYFSDGPGKDVSHHSPSPTPKQRQARSNSISAVMSQLEDGSEDEDERRGWADAATRSAFGILGTLAWRRKKPDRPSIAGKKKASHASKSQSPQNSLYGERAIRQRDDANEDTVSVRSSRTGRSSLSSKLIDIGGENEGNEDTIRAKNGLLRPPVQHTLSGRDVVSAIYEAIGSAPASPENEKKHPFANEPPKPSHFKAICLATRIMTSDPGSVLLNSGRKTSPVVKSMAMAVVERAREEGKMVRNITTARSSRRSSTLFVTPARERSAKDGRDARATPPISTTTSSHSSSTATLSRALGSHKERSASKVTEPNVTRLPQLFGFGVSIPASPRSMEIESSKGKTVKDAKDAAVASEATPMVTELEPILAHDVKPPTLALLARRSTITPQPLRRRKRQGTIDSLDKVSEDEESSGDEFEVYGGKNLQITPMSEQSLHRVNRAEGDEALLTDRYGFVYDATPADVRLLRRARKEATHAPACLTGIRVGVRARGGSDSQSDDDKDDVDLEGPDSEIDDEEEAEKTKDESSNHVGNDSDAASQHTVSSHKTAGTGGASASNNVSLLSVKPSKAVAEASILSAASFTSSSPGPTCPTQEKIHFEGQQSSSTPSSMAAAKRPPSTSQTVKRLLGQLQVMHQDQQTSQQTEWDNFLQRRRAGASGAREKVEAVPSPSAATQTRSSSITDVVRKSGDALGITSKTAGPLFSKIDSAALSEEEWHLGGLVGLSRMGTETKDYQDFAKLIRKGVPLIYRSKIWYECSGAMELNEPGKYQELLLDHENEENPCTHQIDLDIGRTMPTNIYFAGDGPGVIKLRRLLVAFSWYNPKCGYCQGMNNLAATLLLTHATEEEAFWVLVSIIEKILPEEYYTSHLLVSQADQRVLMDLMDEVLPALSAHIRDLGVDLPAVTFAWFLSLYTDCLPVETLFRVWDVMFVEGMIILFRIAIAIFIVNEKELLETSSPSAFYSFVHGMTSHLFSVDRLIKLACEDLKSTVRKEMILERREKHVQDLTIELGLDTAAPV
ncbi:hypothetical protein CBS101457_003309 [Exobasidium rhododendri]|nr:hypothetical protein CBS101457_003309 [Exobasidium rhododendri]